MKHAFIIVDNSLQVSRNIAKLRVGILRVTQSLRVLFGEELLKSKNLVQEQFQFLP